MNEKRLETNESPHIMIPKCDGQVVVKSWLQTAVSIQGPSFEVEQNGNTIRITSKKDLFLAVPLQSSVSLGVVQGDVTLKHLESGITGDDLLGNVTLNNVDAVQIDLIGQSLTGEDLNSTLEVGHVEGAVSLQRVTSVRLGDVNGSVAIDHASGPVELGQVEGNVKLNSINGDVLVANAFLNVTLENLGGNNTLPSVIGDIWLVGGLRGKEQLFVSERGIYVYWPSDAPMHLFANAPQVDNSLPLSNENEVHKGGQLVLTGDIEEGETPLTLKAAYRIAIKPLGLKPPRFVADDFVMSVDPYDELTRLVQTAVHEELTEPVQREGLEDRIVTAVVAALSDWAVVSGYEPTAESDKPNMVEIADINPENKSHILQLVRDRTITIEQAELLLDALNT